MGYALEERELTRWILENVQANVFKNILQAFKKIGPVPHKINDYTRRLYVNKLMNARNYPQTYQLLVEFFQNNNAVVDNIQQVSSSFQGDNKKGILNQILFNFSKGELSQAASLIGKYEAEAKKTATQSNDNKLIERKKLVENRGSESEKITTIYKQTMSQNKLLSQTNIKLLNQITSLKKQIKDKDARSKTKETEISHLNEELKKKNIFEREIKERVEELEKKVGSRDRYIKKERKRINELNKENRVYKAEVSRLNEENIQQQKSIISLQSINNKEKGQATLVNTSVNAPKKKVEIKKDVNKLPFLQIGAPEAVNVEKFKVKYPQADIVIPFRFYKRGMSAKKYDSIDSIPSLVRHTWDFYDHISVYTKTVAMGDRYALKSNSNIKLVVEITNEADFWRQKDDTRE